MMNLIVLDTSTGRTVLGLSTTSGSVHLATTEAGPRHGRDLIPSLRTLLREAGLTPKDINVVAVGVGPGSYTGLRVGLMAAKTLAYATGAGLVGLDSLEAVAWNAPPNCGRVSVVSDAQRGDLYVADFYRVAADQPLALARGCRIESLAVWSAGLEPDVLVLGPGLAWPLIRAAMPPQVLWADCSLDFPQGSTLLALAHQAWASGRRDDFWQLEPRYIRRSAAEDKWDATHPISPHG